MNSTTPEESMSAHLTQPRQFQLLSLSPGLERERRNADARASLAERRARVSHNQGDVRRARQARELADRAARPFQMAA